MTLALKYRKFVELGQKKTVIQFKKLEHLTKIFSQTFGIEIRHDCNGQAWFIAITILLLHKLILVFYKQINIF